MAASEPIKHNQGGVTAATKQQPARPWGSLPKGCNKKRSDRSGTAPGLGMPFIERQQGIPIHERVSLGLKQTVFQSPAAVPRSCIRSLQPLGRDPHGQTSSHV